MNKRILISAILTAAPTAQLTATEIVKVRNDVAATQVAASKVVYKLAKKILGEDDSYDLEVSLVAANQDKFSFWDIETQSEAKSPELDYELQIRFVSRSTGESLDENLSYLLKRVGEGKFALHQTNTTTVVKEVTEGDTAYEVITCNTTAHCELNAADRGLLTIKGDKLTILNPSEVFKDSFAWSQLEGKIEKTLVLNKIGK